MEPKHHSSFVENSPQERMLLKRTLDNDDLIYEELESERNAATRPRHPPEHHGVKRQRKAHEEQYGVLVVHRVHCSSTGRHETHSSLSHFIDAPRLKRGDSKVTPLGGEQEIEDLEKYLEDRGVSFFIYKDYDCDDYHDTVDDQFVRFLPREIDPRVFQSKRDYFYILPEDGPTTRSGSESLSINSSVLKNAMTQTLEEDSGLLKEWENKGSLVYPYPFFFHHHHHTVRETAAKKLQPGSRELVFSLVDRIEEYCYGEYEAARSLFSQGVVTKQHLGKVFRLSDIVITFNDNEPSAFVIDDIAERSTGLLLKAWSYVFDGNLMKRTVILEVDWPTNRTNDTELPISSLSAYPLRYDEFGATKTLRDRGTEFWNCRKRRFVTYSAPRRTFDVQTHAPRFMIDFQMYRELHQKEIDENRSLRVGGKDESVPVSVMEDEKPPIENFFLLLPPYLFGYSMKDKKWRDLQVKHIEQVSWNKNAFDRLVLEPHKKELIEALVSVHLANSVSNDIIEGKGNGLVILLHGGPGTGKTLTAESVAELAQKPLYRVTCGDLGTEAEHVEKYLESVLKIGTIWDCVVLLDEADVFLEERTHQDLQRNALVSVFLRVLEYHEGILILTTNRVGTFDEAFKSRVQLAVYYPTLDEYGRRQIWRDALRSMQSDHVKFDLPGLMDRVDQLAVHKLNGRQIRNTVRSALRLAHFRKQTLVYQHFEQTVDIALEFEAYVEKTHRHTADEWAVEQMTRANEAEL